jgi:hypothetical protein
MGGGDYNLYNRDQVVDKYGLKIKVGNWVEERALLEATGYARCGSLRSSNFRDARMTGMRTTAHNLRGVTGSLSKSITSSSYIDYGNQHYMPDKTHHGLSQETKEKRTRQSLFRDRRILRDGRWVNVKGRPPHPSNSDVKIGNVEFEPERTRFGTTYRKFHTYPQRPTSALAKAPSLHSQQQYHRVHTKPPTVTVRQRPHTAAACRSFLQERRSRPSSAHSSGKSSPHIRF